MSERNWHLAQLNIAKAKDEMDSETMKGFVARLDKINALADRSEGFVWRLQDENSNATGFRVYEDPLLLVNLSVWENIESLKAFVYKSAHVKVMRMRHDWFHKTTLPHLVLWWIPKGKIPSLTEADERLETLRKKGPSPLAFNFAKPHDPPS